jgi:aminoglycoside 3-N-acetyltransferase
MSERETIARTRDRPATIDTLARDLAALGVPSGGILLVHTSLRALGYVIGGPGAAIAALERVLGRDGTLVMPTFTGQLTDPGGWIAPPVPASWWPMIREHEPAFDPAGTPSWGMGVVAELFRTLPGARRSDHPHVSFAARGPAAEAITAGHALADSLGEASPLARLYERDALVLLLGVGHNRNSSIHLAEYRTARPTRRRGEKAGPIRRDGRRVWATFDDLEWDTEDFPALGAAFAAAGLERRGRVGRATSRLMRQRALVDFARSWMERSRPVLD